ncbi:MAG: addiction module protein [Verrucomicrobia bacterium]|nr:addiction module protein [Verrucomicrobiota bacterium]
MELLWRSLSRSPDQTPSPERHREVLASRLAEIERGEAEFLTIEELKQHLREGPQ